MTRRIARTAACFAAAAIAIAILHLLGVDVEGWFASLWDALTAVDREYIVLGLGFQTLETALAYSAGQQLITTAWNVGLAIVLVAIAFGWAGGKELVAASYNEAKERAPRRKRHRRADAESDRIQ